MMVSLAAVLAAIAVPATLSLYGLGKVEGAIAAIQHRHVRANITHELLDQFSDMQSDFLDGLLKNDPVRRAEINTQAHELMRFNSVLDRVMTVSADFIPPERQIALWEAATTITQSWEELTNMNLAGLSDEDRSVHFSKITRSHERVRSVVDEINGALANDNSSYVNAAIQRVDMASMMMIVIMLGGLLIGISASAFVILLVRDTRKAERDVRESEARLSAQNRIFKAALDNMRHGVSMYDANLCLDVINRRFLEIYGFEEGDIYPGLSLDGLRKLRSSIGYQVYSEAGEKITSVFKVTRATNGGMVESAMEFERDVVVNGRIIRVTRTPREDGGWVVMHADITERRRALMALEVRERQLTQQNQRFKDLVEGVSHGMSMFDGDSRLVVCNQAYIDIYGLAGIDPRPGTSFDDITDNIFDRKVYRDHSDEMRAMSKYGVTVKQDVVKIHEFADGRSIMLTRYPRASGGWVAVHEDVTERLRIEREFHANKAVLAAQNEQFSDALENMGQGLSMYDHDNKLVVLNQRYLDIYNLDPELAKPGAPLRAVVASIVGDAMSSSDLDRYIGRFYAEPGARETFTRMRNHGDGRIFEITNHLRPEGGWVTIHNDVTEREAARHELERSESAQRQQSELLKDALDNMGYGLNVFDAKNRILIYNKQYLEMSGLEESDVSPGTSAREITAARRRRGRFVGSSESFVSAHSKELRNCEYFEHVETSKIGQVISSAFYPRAVGGWVVLHRDITEILRAENEMRHAAEESEKLRQQEQAAVAASQAKSTFLAMMSHEIRTPMNAVIGLSSALLGSRLNPDQHHVVDTIHEASDSLLRLLNDILDISKLDAGKVEFEAAPFSLPALVNQVVSIVDAKALEKGLSVRWLLDNDMPPVMVGDQMRIRQVIINLMTNAIKFTESGYVEIKTQCIARTAGFAAIECSVSDTGIGIAPEQMDGLFDDFSQADSSINRRFGGTGLGLAISKRIIEQMGGNILVDSTPGIGTKFVVTLTLPVADESALTDGRLRATTDEFVAMLARAERPLQILLAEDNPTNQLVFTKLMQDCNVEILIADNGRLALEQAQHRIFDAVFMDMRMPEMDGLDATRAIRALGGEWKDIPIIALTANAFADDVRACREAGMDEFISKPFGKKTLLEILAKMLHHHPMLAAAPSAAAPEPGQASEDHEADAMAALPVTPPAEIAMTDVASIFDRRAFDILVEEIDADGVRMALDALLAETGPRLARLRTLSCDADRARIRDEAHTLKGSAGTLALRQVQELARTLEHTAPVVTPEQYRDLLDRLDACFAVGRQEIEAALASVMAARAT